MPEAKDIMFLAHRVPFPPNRGDKIRGFHVLRHLAAHARVHLIAFADDPGDYDPAPEFRALCATCTVVPRTKSRPVAVIQALAHGRPVSLAAFADDRVGRAIATILETQPIEAIYVFSGQMAQYLPASGPRAIMDFVDVDSAKFAAYADDAIGPKRWMMRREARLLARFERDVAGRAAASLFVSKAEAALFRRDVPHATVLAVENGIDTGFFDPIADFATVDRAGPLIAFTGQMDYRPNIDAVRWFADAVLPLIRLQRPDAQFAIIGRAPTAAVMAIASDSVVVTGAVDDVRGWIAAAAVVVAPLKLARGVQNKVLEAMAMARPVVASAAAAEGIDHGGTIRIGQTAEEIADHVVALIGDRRTAAALGRSARARVIDRYGWKACLSPLDGLLGFDRRRCAA